MAWQTPTLTQVRQMVRDDVTASLKGVIIVGNTVLRVVCDAMAGLARLILKYIDWLALMLLPDTAEDEWLDRHGQIWLVNADGTKGRKGATPSRGTVTFTGAEGAIVPQGSQLQDPSGNVYQTLQDCTIGTDATECAVQCITSGTITNLPAGTQLSLTTAIADVDNAATVVLLAGGNDQETDDQLRARILKRIQEPPMGGCATDYEQWALSIPSVTRAWCAPREMGMGTVTVRIMCDVLRNYQNGIPIQDDLDAVTAYMDTVRPVAVRDFWVMAPVPEPIDFSLSLTYDSTTLRDQVTQSVTQMLQEKGAPAHSQNGELVAGTTIKAAWVSEAINRVTNDFDLTMVDHPMPHNGAIAVMGTISWPVPLLTRAHG